MILIRWTLICNSFSDSASITDSYCGVTFTVRCLVDLHLSSTFLTYTNQAHADIVQDRRTVSQARIWGFHGDDDSSYGLLCTAPRYRLLGGTDVSKVNTEHNFWIDWGSTFFRKANTSLIRTDRGQDVPKNLGILHHQGRLRQYFFPKHSYPQTLG
jgi:hypothetical protein